MNFFSSALKGKQKFNFKLAGRNKKQEDKQKT